ncbi:Uncharacterised protein [Serratia marcescens]|uniref:hypothetical protein n=1 Tax=Serratia marcescens TaxID=615 RepID=UPI000744E726|nr:hypothetical protein [Serratia marcescens]CUZ13958.1 Uncharacterised protein [Serratia marcescens]CVD96118.1 Uncharacterised protein [Serratia marcescens]
MAQRYNTLNPRPSNSMKDLNDNALAYDDYLNSDDDEAIDRFGRGFPTVRKQVNERIDELGGYSKNAEDSAIEAKEWALSAQNIADANTYYITPDDPDGTRAGLAGTPNGQSFRVAQGVGGGFKYYRNDTGVAVEIAAVAGEAAIAAVQAVQQFLSAMTPEDLTAATPDWLHAWTDKNRNMVGGFGLDGGLNLCGMPDAVQDRVKALADYLTAIKMPGYHSVVLDTQGRSGFAVTDDWGLLLAGLEKPVQDEINALKTGGGSALLRPFNGLLAVFKDAVSTMPVYSVNPVAYASKLTTGGASIVYDDAGTTKTGTLNLREPLNLSDPANNFVQRPIPAHVARVLYRQGLGQSLMVGGGSRVTSIDPGLLGLALVFFGAGGDRGAGGNGLGEGPVTDANLNVFKDAESIGSFRENCMVPGLQRFLNDLMSQYGIQKSTLPAVVTRMDAKSGTAYAGLKKGTQPYTDGMTAFTSFVERVLEQGKIPVSHSIFITHGEADSGTVTALGQYKGYLNEWVNDEQADQIAILAAHGMTQSQKPVAYIDQMGSIGKSATNRGDWICYDQLAISNERADVVCTGPAYPLNRKYPLSASSGEVHLTGMGYAIKGEFQGQAEAFMYKERLAESNKKWIPVQPISMLKNGLVIDVTFSSPFGLPLKVNTKYGAAPNLGADIENGSANIVSAVQKSDFVFSFTLDKEPAVGEFIRFGLNATDNQYRLVCISDTSQRVSKSDPTFMMENFCCVSHIAIS